MFIPSPLEIWGFAFLGRPDGHEEVFLQVWYFLDKRWIADTFLGGHLGRKWSSSRTVPALYSIVRRKSDTIALVMATPPAVTFRRDSIGPRLAAWNTLLQRLESIQLDTGPDEFCWNLHPNGKFSVCLLYNAIIQSDIPVGDNKKIWKMKIPLKTKIFGWYLRRGIILTKDNLVKHN
jgi:hypothetical protein